MARSIPQAAGSRRHAARNRSPSPSMPVLVSPDGTILTGTFRCPRFSPRCLAHRVHVPAAAKPRL